MGEVADDEGRGGTRWSAVVRGDTVGGWRDLKRMRRFLLKIKNKILHFRTDYWATSMYQKTYWATSSPSAYIWQVESKWKRQGKNFCFFMQKNGISCVSNSGIIKILYNVLIIHMFSCEKILFYFLKKMKKVILW